MKWRDTLHTNQITISRKEHNARGAESAPIRPHKLLERRAQGTKDAMMLVDSRSWHSRTATPSHESDEVLFVAAA